MPANLTKTLIDQLQCPPGKRDLVVFDTALRGFGVRVTERGRKVFFLQYKRDGRVRRLVIGTYGEITLAQARKAAEQSRGSVRSGDDPVEERRVDAVTRRAIAAAQASRSEFTVEVLLDRWVEIGLKGRSDRHRAGAPRAVRALLKNRLADPADTITAEEVQQAIDQLAERAAVLAIRTRAYGRAAWNWAIKRRLLKENPFDGAVIEHRERARDRVLTDNELREAWLGAGAMEWPFGPFIRLLILTLQRRGEVAEMAWSELAPDLSAWTIPATRAKNGRAHIVHLSEPARAILQSLPRQVDAAGKPVDLIFTTTGNTPVSGFNSAAEGLRKAVAQLRRAELGDAGAELGGASPAFDWVLHDFRRTGVTRMAELGIAPHVADRILNHVTGSIRGVMAVYQRSEFLGERKQALELWARHVLAAAAGPADRTNVLNFARPDDLAPA